MAPDRGGLKAVQTRQLRGERGVVRRRGRVALQVLEKVRPSSGGVGRERNLEVAAADLGQFADTIAHLNLGADYPAFGVPLLLQLGRSRIGRRNQRGEKRVDGSGRLSGQI